MYCEVEHIGNKQFVVALPSNRLLSTFYVSETYMERALRIKTNKHFLQLHRCYIAQPFSYLMWEKQKDAQKFIDNFLIPMMIINKLQDGV